MRYFALLVVFMLSAFVTPPLERETLQPLEKAFIVFTKKSWGCLEKQEIRADVTDELREKDSKVATLHELIPMEDVQNQLELYLVFREESVSQDGFLVFQLTVTAAESGGKGYLAIDYARLVRENARKLALEFRVQGDGKIRGALFYSQSPEIRRGWGTCPAMRDVKPVQTDFFNVFPIEAGLVELPKFLLDKEWQDVRFSLTPMFHQRIKAVNHCLNLLKRLNATFGEDEQTLLWNADIVSERSLRLVGEREQSVNGTAPFDILLNFDDGRQVNTTANKFVPLVRQTVALKNADGKMNGAELWIRTDIEN